MYYMQKLPYILAALMTFIIGAASKAVGSANKTIYIRMLISLVGFIVIGFLLRSIIVNIYEEYLQKKQSELIVEEDKKVQAQIIKPTIDIKIDDTLDNSKYDEEFTPLKVSEVIKSKMKDE